MNIFKNLLILFGTDCRVQVIGLEGGKDSSNTAIDFNILRGEPKLFSFFSNLTSFDLRN